MGLKALLLKTPIFWRIKKDDPLKYEVQSYSNTSFLNPLIYSKLNFYNTFSDSLETLIFISDEEVLVSERIIVFETNNESDENNDFIEFTQSFLSSARLVSKQFTISEILGISVFNETEIPQFTFPKSISTKMFLKKYYLDSSISFEQLPIIDTNILKPQIKIFSKLFLDAIQAFSESDYKKSLLYSAMSIETLASIKLDEIYENKKQESDSKIRITSFIVNATTRVNKDPIYEFLIERGKFSELLHEIPLYLINKSLLIENNTLFLKAKKIYQTRNNIAHTGEPQDISKVYGENRNDALEVLNCVLKIFSWFGEDNNFPLPTTKFIKINFE